jgi:putative SOS response-associated peptidase YedK
MCGRYRLGRGREAFVKYFGTDADDLDWSPRYNIAPTQNVPTIRQDAKEPKRTASLLRWGLFPRWAADASLGAKLINARSETVAAKPSFRACLRERRCLIPADGFYEWKRTGKARQPYCFALLDDSPFAFAGIWDRWRAPNGNMVESCSILTTAPNAIASDVHDRMPVILSSDDYDVWLDPGLTKVEALIALLRPYGGEMTKYPVSTRVNDADNDDPQCAERVEIAQAAQRSMFAE